MNKTTLQASNSIVPKSKPRIEGKVVHRLPGRIRLRIDRLHDDMLYGNDLQQAATALEGVTEVRVSALASSIVITYHPSELSEQQILDCLGISLPIVKVARKPIDRPIAEESDNPEEDFVESTEKLTAEITSETIGEIVGETVGELLMGPIGMLIGAEIGAKIGEEIGEEIEGLIFETKGSSNEHLAEESVNSANEPIKPNPPPNRHNQKTPRQKK